MPENDNIFFYIYVNDKYSMASIPLDKLICATKEPKGISGFPFLLNTESVGIAFI